MGFEQGLSGLNAASKSLDVIGNNVANSSTVGFKESQAQFADVYASSMGGSAADQAGIGVRVATVAQQFTQGNITTTNNSLDMAISGSGFFRMDNNGSITYSRNGQFQLDKNGFIVDNQGNNLTGFLPNAAGTIVATTPAAIQISTANLLPKQPQRSPRELNLNARLGRPDGIAVRSEQSLDLQQFHFVDDLRQSGREPYRFAVFCANRDECMECISDGRRSNGAAGRHSADEHDIQYQRHVDDTGGSGDFAIFYSHECADYAGRIYDQCYDYGDGDQHYGLSVGQQ